MPAIRVTSPAQNGRPRAGTQYIPSTYPSQFGPATPNVHTDASGNVALGQQTQFSMPMQPAQGGTNPYALSPYAVPTGGGDAGGSSDAAPGGLSAEDIFGVLDRLKGQTPGREPAPAPPPRIAAPTPAAEAPSQSLAFARYKDQSGRVGNAALRALKDQMTERGISGSGIEGSLTASVLGEVARGQGDAAFQQQLASENQAWEAAKLGYQGAINQRSNDMGLSGTGYSGGITQRGQDIASNDMTSLAPTILALLSRARY